MPVLSQVVGLFRVKPMSASLVASEAEPFSDFMTCFFHRELRLREREYHASLGIPVGRELSVFELDGSVLGEECLYLSEGGG